jgi:hypothetical protein
MASDIAVGFAIGLVIGFALGYAVRWLFPFGVIKQQGSGASFSEINSHALLG